MSPSSGLQTGSYFHLSLNGLNYYLLFLINFGFPLQSKNNIYCEINI